MARIPSIISLVLLCILPATMAIKFYKYGRCVKASPCANIPTNGLVDDWALLVATAPAKDNLLTYWGPTFVGCDTNSIQETCCNQGIYYLSGDDTGTSSGFSYGYNVQLEKWTMQNFVTNKRTVPGTSLTAYETFYYAYVTIDNDKLSGNYSSSTTEITVNPMVRKTRWVLLDTDQNKSYRITMNCENVDGFLYNGFPQIQIYVKRSQVKNFSVNEINQLTMYESIAKALTSQKINPEYIKKYWRIISQTLACPTETLYKSINWDCCNCKLSGLQALSPGDDKGYY